MKNKRFNPTFANRKKARENSQPKRNVNAQMKLKSICKNVIELVTFDENSKSRYWEKIIITCITPNYTQFYYFPETLPTTLKTQNSSRESIGIRRFVIGRNFALKETPITILGVVTEKMFVTRFLRNKRCLNLRKNIN